MPGLFMCYNTERRQCITGTVLCYKIEAGLRETLMNTGVTENRPL